VHCKNDGPQLPGWLKWAAGVMVTAFGAVALLAVSMAVVQPKMVAPLAVDPEAPPAHLMGWAGPEEAARARSEIPFPKFKIVGDAAPIKGKKVVLWDAAKLVYGDHLPNYPQEIGDCVSFGTKNALEYLSAVQIIMYGEPIQWRPVFPSYIYGISRVKIGKGRIGCRSDGSIGAWAADGVREFGVLFSDADGVPHYAGSVAREWGCSGPPAKFIAAAKEFLVKTTAPVDTADEAAEALCNGYPVTIASNVGFSNHPPVVKGRLLNSRQGTWNHQMCLIGYDDSEPGGPFFYILNSWGGDAHGKDPAGGAPGGFWVKKADVEAIVRQRDSFAYSQFTGFPAQDWLIVSQAVMRREIQRGPIDAKPRYALAF